MLLSIHVPRQNKSLNSLRPASHSLALTRLRSRILLLSSFLALFTISAAALDPSLQITQYAHTAWRIEDEGLVGAPTTFAQTKDGYLWIGTLGGLLRFDGVRFDPWSGNIRELQNVIDRSVILCDSEIFSVDENWLSSMARPATALSQELVSRERGLIEAALAECKGRVAGASGAAAKLGMPASTLDSKIRALKIEKRRFHTN
jgi:ligand-binding sensor domain-containing protein